MAAAAAGGASPGGGTGSGGGAALEEECEVVRVRVKKSEGQQPPEFRSFAVDPQITSLDVLQHILARAFDLQGKKSFSLSFAARDGQGQDTFVPLLSDSDLANAFTCARPTLRLRLDVRNPPDSPLLEDWDIISPREVAAVEPVPERRSLLAAALPFTQALLAQVGRTLARAQAALAWPEGSPAAPPPPPPPPPCAPLSDADLRSYLGPGGRLLRPQDLRLHVFHGGVEPGLRKVVWRYLLNVFPAGLSGQERLSHLRLKAAEYSALKVALAARAAPAELAQVAASVRKDVVRTDRAHPYFGGPEEGHPHLAALQALLTTFALGHPRLSYCQGMSDVAAPLLAVLDDEAQAFLCFCSLMRRLGPRFRPGGRGLSRAFSHLRRLLRRADPPFWAFLAARGAHDLLFCYRWLLLELKREFAFEDALRVLEITWSSLPPSPPPPPEGVPLLGAPLGARRAQRGLRERRGLRPRPPRRRRRRREGEEEGGTGGSGGGTEGVERAGGVLGGPKSASDVLEGPEGVQEGPRDIQEGPRDIQEGPKSSTDISEGSKDIQEGPKGIQEGPRSASDVPDGPRGSSDVPEGPRDVQEGPKSSSDVQEGPRDIQEGLRGVQEGPKSPSDVRDCPRAPSDVPEGPESSSGGHKEPKSSSDILEGPRDSQEGPQSFENIQEGPESSRNVLEGPKSSRDVPKGPKSSRNVPKGPKSSRNIHEGPKSSRNVPERPKSSRNVPKGPKSSRNIQERPPKDAGEDPDGCKDTDPGPGSPRKVEEGTDALEMEQQPNSLCRGARGDPRVPRGTLKGHDVPKEGQRHPKTPERVGDSVPRKVGEEPRELGQDPKGALREVGRGPKSPREGGDDPKEGQDDPKEGQNDPREGHDGPGEGFDDPKEGHDLREQCGDPKEGHDDPRERHGDPKEGHNDPREGRGDPEEGHNDPGEERDDLREEHDLSQGHDDPKDDHHDPKDDHDNPTTTTTPEDPWGGRWAWEDSSSSSSSSSSCSSSSSSSSEEEEVTVEDDGAPLPPPEELGQGNPFLLFVCLAMLLEQREAVMARAGDYNEVAMHFDRLVRRHHLPRVLRRAKGLFARYLEGWGGTAPAGPPAGPPSG